MDIKAYSLFLAGLLAGGAGTAGVLATAAPGDVIHEVGGGKTCVSAPQAACFATCAISAGAWDGAAADMMRVKAWREDSCPAGFAASVRGLKASPAGSVPVGSVIHGVSQ